MGHLYFVRHGQTIWNVENKICGATDIALTEFGHEQAVETGRKIAEEGIKADEILYSPLIRAAETARYISEITGIPRRVEPRLIEQNFGKWEGTPRNGADFKKAKEIFACNYEGGESMLHLAQRIYNLLDEIKAESGEKTYILVAHNGIARMVQSYFHDMTNEEYAAFGVSAVMEKEEKLEQIADYMGELKDEFAALIQEFDEDGADQRKLDTLTEALDALEDAYDMVNEVL